MSSRSSSSSPDILGPPGDAEFLISSPTKPFSGRQSWASPANFSLLQTSAKRKRTSTSPSKGAHSIHFDDIVLPSSPSKKLNSPQAPKASSPTKGEPDENSSPWRIRVTVEASQDDENNGHGTSPSRKRFKPETTTMKVPLRDDKAMLEQIPKRRKARPRKSSVGVAPHTGGPGSTPKPKVIGDSKMSTAQPRKMSPTLQVAKGKEEMRHTPSAEPEQRWSPLDLAADGDSDDGFPDAPTAVGGNGQKAEQAETNEPVGSSPVRESIEAGNDGLNTRSTNLAQNENDRNYDTNARPSPSRTPSPTLEEDYQLQENTLHAGHTPTARRIYPTPTSSSLLEEEQHERRQDTSVAFDGDFRRSERRARNDPTDEHREFDSIMESEGFSMVSLDTLPSSKQHRLASNQKPAQPSSKHPDEQNSKVYDSMGRRASTGDKYDKVVPISPARQQDPRLSRNLALPRSPSNSPDSLLDYGQDLNIKGTTAEIDPPLSIPSSVQFPATVATKSKPFPSLGRVVRVGMALQGTFRRQRRRSTLRSPSSSPESGDHGGGSQSARKRLERLFGDLNPDTQRELRVGLGIGQALAKRQKQVEIRRAKERTSKRAAATDNNKTGKALTEDSHVSYVEAKAPEKMRREGTEKGTFDSEIKRREVEWQREREANSRDIQMANSSQVIVVNSDAPSAEEGSDEDNRSGHEESDRGQERPESVSEVESEPESEQGSAEPIEPKSEPKPEFESEAEAQSDSGSESQAESRSGSKASPGSEQEISDEEGYEDIWQQEAKDLHSGDSTPQPRMRQRPSRQNIIPYTIPSDEAGTASPAYWVAGNEEVPFLGKSRVRQLREQEVDLSVWFRDRDTPDRFRYFYGNSTPQSIISNQSPVRRPVPGYSTATVSDEVGLHGASSQSGREVSSSPDRFSPVDNHILRYNAEDNGRSDLHRDQSAERDDGESVPDLPDHEAHEVYNRSSQSKSVSARNDGVINSRTPAWLKAPNFRHGGQSTATRPDVDEEWPEEEAEEMRLRSRRSIKVADIEGERRNALSPDHERTAVEDNDDNAISEEEEEKEDPVQYPHLSPLRDDHIHDTGIPRDERPTDSEPKRRRRPLSLSGYFTDNHYILLGHLYNLAKQDPELFPYHPTRGRANIIGDWIWTSDGKYGVPVTEGQFAIIDRFVQRLVHADLDYGGNGLMGWTDADLHRRLISIIIGEQIRANREAMMREDGLYGEEE